MGPLDPEISFRVPAEDRFKIANAILGKDDSGIPMTIEGYPRRYACRIELSPIGAGEKEFRIDIWFADVLADMIDLVSLTRSPLG